MQKNMAKKETRKTSKKKPKPIQAYAFIDTNLFLDFYRSSNEANLSLLEKLNTVRGRIISTYQVEMEFLKNRQTTLLGAIKEVRAEITGSVPAVITDSHTKEALKRLRDDGGKRVKMLKTKVEKVLANPNINDRVYQVLEGIFSSEESHVLTRDMTERQQIKRRALRRFLLGYPPRKSNDTSCGDALNWEWIIECSKNLKGRIYLVSRDGDYGCEHDGKFYLNDHLKKEFRDRVGNKSIVFTRKLSDALKALEVHVTKQEEEAEDRALSKVTSPKWTPSLSISDEFTKSIQEAVNPFRSEEFQRAIQELQASLGIFAQSKPNKGEVSLE
jgi:predicted nucleic acid-binding protein